MTAKVGSGPNLSACWQSCFFRGLWTERCPDEGISKSHGLMLLDRILLLSEERGASVYGGVFRVASRNICISGVSLIGQNTFVLFNPARHLPQPHAGFPSAHPVRSWPSTLLLIG